MNIDMHRHHGWPFSWEHRRNVA